MASHFYPDASALAKRYAPEPGTPVVNYLFSQMPAQRMFVLRLGAAEVVSILIRKRNAKILSRSITIQALTDLEAEIITQAALRKLDADADLINAALPLIVRHSINATDAVQLRSALDLAVVLRAGGDDLAMVASDHRLLRSAQAEGLLVFNPETQTTADLDQLLV